MYENVKIAVNINDTTGEAFSVEVGVHTELNFLVYLLTWKLIVSLLPWW